MKNYHLTLGERIQIKLLIEEGYCKAQVAKRIDRHKSTIGRELAKWGISGNIQESIKDYDPELAQWAKIENKGIVSRFEYKLINNKILFNKVKAKLTKRWSPQQISHWLKRTFKNNKNLQVSHETIYRFIYFLANKSIKELFITFLRRKKKNRKSNYGKTRRVGLIKDRLSIDKRPKHIENRKEFGHWEGDLIIGKDKKDAIGTLVERKTKFTIIVPLKNRKSKTVVKSFARALSKFPDHFKKSLTYDNGSEMAAHKLFTKLTGMPVYFCNPYSSWERGTNENTNGLIRDFWPKKFDFKTLSYYDIKKVQKLLNERPREILDWCSPKFVFQKYYL